MAGAKRLECVVFSDAFSGHPSLPTNPFHEPTIKSGRDAFHPRPGLLPSEMGTRVERVPTKFMVPVCVWGRMSKLPRNWDAGSQSGAEDAAVQTLRESARPLASSFRHCPAPTPTTARTSKVKTIFPRAVIVVSPKSCECLNYGSALLNLLFECADYPRHFSILIFPSGIE